MVKTKIYSYLTKMTYAISFWSCEDFNLNGAARKSKEFLTLNSEKVE